MSIVLYHHPFSRAAATLWMLEEIGVDYELRFIDMMAGAHKAPEMLALNPMGKLPVLTDGDEVVTENCAIGLYLADRYSLGRLAPAPDDPGRGAYLRWSVFAPSVVEPGLMAKAAGWQYKHAQAGWGGHESMLASLEAAIGEGPYLLGEQFTMADIILGGTIRWMLQFGMLEKREVFTAYGERLGERPANKRAQERNAAVMKEQGIEPRG